MPLQIRRGTEAERGLMTQPLAEGELLYVTDNQQIFIGNGSTLGGIPIIGYNDQAAQNATAALFTNSISPNIIFSYDSAEPAINVSLDFTAPFDGIIRSSLGFAGSLIGDDDITIFDASENAFLNLEAGFLTTIGPKEDNTFDIGTSSIRFREGFFHNINVIDQTVVGDIVVKGLIKTEDSAILFDPTTNTLTANSINGDLYGSVFNDDEDVVLVNSADSSLSTENLTLIDDSITSSTRNISFGGFDSPVNLRIFTDLVGDGSSDTTRSWLELFGNIDLSFPQEPDSPWVDFFMSRGNTGNPLAVENQDILTGLMFFGFDGTQYSRTNTLAVRVNGTVQEDIVPGEFLFICQTDTVNESSVMTFTGNQGVLSAPTIKPGVYDDDTARDAFLTAPEEGMMIFNKALQKFQGYVSDTGIAGGGAPNSTPGWVNLN